MNIMQQIPMFTEVDAPASDADDRQLGNSARLRDYQQRISDQALALLTERKNPLIVMAVGTGKTRTAANIVRMFPGRTLWLAHRIELVNQAAAAIEDALQERVDIEAVGRFSSNSRVVVASRDTIRTDKRLSRLGNYNRFDLIVVDECHHAPAASYRKILGAYPAALRLGLTATPQRLDKISLRAFDCATESFSIVDAAQSGWLVPIRAKRVSVKSIDLSGVGTVAGDFNRGELDMVMKSEANCHAISNAILERHQNFPCLLFSTSVDVATRQAEVLCRSRPGIARVVTGKTPPLERARAFAELGKQYQVLVNVGVAVEGTDLPQVATVAIGRPTKSTSLFVQMLGRGLRPLPGTVDGMPDVAARHKAIANSKKPHCLVLDFVGTSGRHSVATVVDAFADMHMDGSESGHGDADVKLRERLEAGEEFDLAGALAEEIQEDVKRKEEARKRKKEQERRRAALVARVELTSSDVRLIGLGGEIAETDTARSILDGPPTPGQVHELSRLGCTWDGIETARDAKKRIEAVRAERDYASPRMLELIRRHRPELATPDLKRKRAGWIISQIKRAWSR